MSRDFLKDNSFSPCFPALACSSAPHSPVGVLGGFGKFFFGGFLEIFRDFLGFLGIFWGFQGFGFFFGLLGFFRFQEFSGSRDFWWDDNGGVF